MKKLITEVNDYIVNKLPKNKQFIITELDSEHDNSWEEGCDYEYFFIIKISTIENINEVDLERFNIYNT